MGLLTSFHKYYLNCSSCMYTASCFATWQQSNVRDMHVDMVMKAWWSLNWESECRRKVTLWHGCWFCQYLWSCWSAAIFPRQQFLGFTEKGLEKKSNKQQFRGWPQCFKLIGRNKPNKQTNNYNQGMQKSNRPPHWVPLFGNWKQIWVSIFAPTFRQ